MGISKQSKPGRKFASPPGHYVYLFRDTQNQPQYVGYGRSFKRAVSHLSGSHNKQLNHFLQSGKYTLEIAGPFDTKNTGLAVETALISALKAKCNRAPGQTKWQFRPLGVPEKYADRLTLSALERKDFLQIVGGGSVLFVYVNDKNFTDGRVGYDPATPPSDSRILQRIDKWWQLGRYTAEWVETPANGPSVLVGISGRPGSRVVIGAVRINSSGWKNAKRDEDGLLRIPTSGPSNLDAFELRGRRVSANANIMFGAFSHQFFIIMNRTGKSIGGSPASRIRP